MDVIARAWSKAVRTALPGPWRFGLVVREVVGALLIAGLAAPIEVLSGTGLALPMAVASGLLFLVRRGLPATALVLTAVASGLGGGTLPLLVCVGWSAGARIRRVGVLAGSFAAGWALMTLFGVFKDAGQVPAKLIVGFSLGGYLLLAVLPALWGRYRAQRRALTDALRERNEQLVREHAMIAHQARLRERHRIAQDMHDSLGHQLALISVHTGALEVDRTLTDRQREAVGVLRLAAVAAMRELREVVGVLHDESTALPPGPGPGPAAVVGVGAGAGAGGVGSGGVDGIEALVESSRAAGTPVSLLRDGERRPLAASAGHAAYRVVQEALTNAHKHAPGAPITVALRYEPDALVVEVVNPAAPEPVGVRAGGAAPAVVSGGQGLTGLRERARLVGGMVHAGPTAGAGFRLAAVLPYRAADGAAAQGVDAGSAAGPETGAAYPEADAWPLGVPGAAAGPPKRRSPAIGCAVGGVAVLAAVLGLLVWGVAGFVRAAEESTVKRSVYDSTELGAPEAEVRKQLPRGSDFFLRNLEGTGPTPPEGADCVRYLSDDNGGTAWGEDAVVRFCFKDGVLVEKQHYRVKQ
ncbi:sensor histidine kinase [Kitasatospora purpeofusca]|uniref:sensor histidine kinase n=1 Tax=Kitasatospora purpeofusca TaxID=67352 RepID=UPI00224DEE5D|nr:histidine kinase [Kitasatospora purpeofusca]MCX4756052.1 histidine kinase [Kitasatospora purpeofusca]WSR36106.1 histidine kinase [Kitasatospora purpeofusca]